MKQLTNFKSTLQFFNYIQKNLKSGYKLKETGELFEAFTSEWHLVGAYGEYISIYDANDIQSIPSSIIDRIDGWELLSKGANSFAIDKICVDRYGSIDIHQDKSTMHMDKNLSSDKAAKMMSVRDNPITNIRNWVINTTAQDLSHYSKLWKIHTPVTYGYNQFIPNPLKPEEVTRDKQFWENIKLKVQNKPTHNILNFVSRGPDQDNYIAAGIDYVSAVFPDAGYAKWYQLAVGALGKSVLDPVILAELEHLFDSSLTNTPQPVSVSAYHSSKTLPKNGLEEVQRRRAKGIYDEVIVVSGTDVVDGEGDIGNNIPFRKYSSAESAVVAIRIALDQGKSVLILTLYHHGKTIAQIKNLMNEYYPDFKFWFRKRDECDWPCSNVHSCYAPLLDNRTESILTFGSSGTERLGKDPVLDYGVNNINIHGPCVHNFRWADAENSGLVKPLILIMPCIKESEVAQLFPEYTDKDGRIDWNLRVKGIPVDNTYPTLGLLADLIALARTMVQYPQVKRGIIFASRVKNNKLAEANWDFVCEKVLSSSLLSKSAKKVFWKILNDGEFNSESTKDHNVAIKQAEAYDRHFIGCCRALSRGYDNPHHHACIHLDPTNIVDAVQGIWRTTRLDPDHPEDPYAYYILIMRWNDLDDEPTGAEDRLRLLTGILQHNKNVQLEFESLIQNPNGSRKARKPHEDPRIWIPEDFDPTLFNDLITWVTSNSKGKILKNIILEGHSAITESYLKLPFADISNTNSMQKLKLDFSSNPKFKVIIDTFGRTDDNNEIAEEFFRSFRKGSYMLGKWKNDYSEDIILNIQKNVIEMDMYRQKCLERKDRMISKIQKKYTDLYLTLLYSNFNTTFLEDAATEFDLKYSTCYKYVTPAKHKLKSSPHWEINQRLVYKALLTTGVKLADKGWETWVNETIDYLKNNTTLTITDSYYNILHDVFLARKKYINVLTTAEKKQLVSLKEANKGRGGLPTGKLNPNRCTDVFIGTHVVTGKVIKCNGSFELQKAGFSIGDVKKVINGGRQTSLKHTWTKEEQDA